MPQHREKRILSYPADCLFDLVADIERYPEFLPWCRRAVLREKTEQGVIADLYVGAKGFQDVFTSQVRFDGKRAIEVRYGGGALSHLTNSWRFTPLPDGRCEVDFYVDFALRSRMLSFLMEAFFDFAFTRMVQAFEDRARALYGFPQAIIFDWDNTLADSGEAIAEALNAARAAYGLETWSREQARANSARALRETFPEWFGAEWEKARDIFYTHYEATHAQKVRPLAGAQELLSFCKRMGMPLMLVSNKRKDLLRQEIEALGWKDFFVSVKGSLDLPRDKPDPLPVLLSLQEAGVRLQDGPVWFVGDGHTDVECARASGTVPVLVYNAELAKKMSVALSFSDCHTLQDALYNQSKMERP